ncbi:GIY-YIG nuclease family protein [Agrobacterium tumefaciens]|uniref:GIY-YIG nuclease family protein n=1 Tax=Agrobacterium tumefaciens TaxID=358 RepID=UPI00045978B2|nr:GIY-YIG nuclease family protein [Agrobacterium tumefaciens]CDN95931.1 hypothetical protein BN949_05103 [Agrobacterium tumefaciens]
MFDIQALPGREFGPRRLYAFLFADGRMKVGISNNVRGRAKTLEYEHRRNGVCPEIKESWFSIPHRNALENEACLHEVFKSARLSGEYFAIDMAMVDASSQSLDFRDEATTGETARGAAFVAAFDRAKAVPSALQSAMKQKTLNDEIVEEARAIFGDIAADQLKERFARAA